MYLLWAFLSFDRYIRINLKLTYIGYMLSMYVHGEV